MPDRRLRAKVFMNNDYTKQRIIQELVPGRQITLAHIIANPDPVLYASLSVDNAAGNTAIGVFNVTPSDAAVIIADIAVKSSGARIISADRASGSLLISGAVSDVESAAAAIINYVGEKLGFEICNITKT